ncbi:MAG TPA: polynucleotide adenylyltransferase PcnB, partial [Caldimonas sp.]
LWHDVLEGWTRGQAAGEAAFPALQQAIDAAFDARIGDISGRGKLAVDMREIWMLQPRLERRAANSAPALLEQPRFRAGLDFLRLRGEVGEADPALAVWWEALFEVSDDERREMIEAVREQRGPRRVKRAAPAPGEAGGGDVGRAGARTDEAAEAVDTDASSDDAVAPDGAAPRRRRRRRRRPAVDPAGTPS